MISIIDYGLGNLKSVHKALNSLGFTSKITSSIKDIDNCNGIIFPGVGSFGDCMKQLDDRGCLLYTSPSPRDGLLSRMPSSA